MDIPSYLMGRIAGSRNARTVVVTELPETGEPNVIYLVPKQTIDDNDIFDEYIWVEDDWELIGSTAIDISGKQDIMQFSTMPTADSTTVGKIIQYTGTTNANYTNGYFYVGINDNGSYSWSNINVQHTNPTEPQTYYIVADVGDITDSTTKTTINNLTLLNQIIDVLNDAYSNGYKTFELKIINDVDTLHAKYRVFRLIPQWNIQDTGSGEIEYEGFSFRSYDVYLNPPDTGRSPNVGMYYHNWEMTAQFTNGRFSIDSEATEIEVYSIPISSLVQYNTMPTASSSTVGRIVQYVGTTTNDYTNGYFYIGISTTESNETTYGWSNVNVQKADIPNTYTLYDLEFPLTTGSKIYNDEELINFVKKCKETSSSSGLLVVRGTEGVGYINISGYNNICFTLIDRGVYSDPETRQLYIALVYTNNVVTGVSVAQNSGHYRKILSYDDGYGTNPYAQISDVLTKTNTTAFTPTADYNPATKKYVDDIGSGIKNATTGHLWELSNGYYYYNGNATYASGNSIGSGIHYIIKFGGDSSGLGGNAYVLTFLSGLSSLTYFHVITGMNPYGYDTTSTKHSFKIFEDMALKSDVPSMFGVNSYSRTTTYQIGDYIQAKENNEIVIYKCNTANTTGTWDSAKWTVSSMMEYLNDTLIGSALGGSY